MNGCSRCKSPVDQAFRNMAQWATQRYFEQVESFRRHSAKDKVETVTFTAALLLTLFCLAHYSTTWIRFQYGSARKVCPKVPATIPSFFPILGSGISFIWNPMAFVRSATFYNGEQRPVQVSVMGSKIFLVQGQRNILSLFKQSTLSTATFVHMFCLKNMFGMRPGPLSIYAADDSGDRPEPYAGSAVKANNRVNFLTHESLARYLTGPSMSRLFSRFERNLSNRLACLQIGDEWTEIPDFLDFVQMELSAAVLEAMAGPELITQNPSFVRDLFAYDAALASLSKGVPRILNPGAHAIRDRMLSTIKRWHVYAREHFSEDMIGPEGDFDPCWGSGLMRSRQRFLGRVDGFDADALASSDLGLIWATIANAVPLAFWAIVHIYRDPNLLSRVREEVCSSKSETKSQRSPALSPSRQSFHTSLLDIESLMHKPLLQSIYAEILRLYVRGYITRCPDRSDLQINEWIFPRDKVILVSSDPAHFDPQIWNTKGGLYPLDAFWAERFLVYRNDPTSGPVRKDVDVKDYDEAMPQDRQGKSSDLSSMEAVEASAKFTLNGLNGSWIPYGGGSRSCPASFDAEVISDDKAMAIAEGRYGLGAQKPSGKISLRVRRPYYA
ncbi:MAG: hypothetical protein Q9217_003211 [Psora testacea]